MSDMASHFDASRITSLNDGDPMTDAAWEEGLRRGMVVGDLILPDNRIKWPVIRFAGDHRSWYCLEAVFDRPLTSAERGAMDWYVAEKYRIPIPGLIPTFTLPGHE